ncbi:aminoglycoside 6'-N-acetyltransferase [Enterococcus sp.]|uniref:aminoglycoside 6'-N-acetyltransferase n=1 Tax=Enterococcus sp. TaxID=35783 RepID=UPI002FCC12CB
MIRQASLTEITLVATLAQELWPENTVASLEAEMRESLKNSDTAFFLYYTDNQAVAFSHVQLRHDYVEGTDSSPVGYLEGIYVREALRKQGIAGQLLTACQTWATQQGCTEFASDCELTNDESLRFHLSHGFIEANRIICFTKKL